MSTNEQAAPALSFKGRAENSPHVNAIAKATENEFLPNTVGRAAAEKTASDAAAERSMNARIAAAVAEGNAAPLWRGPRARADRIASAHLRLRKQNEERQNNQ